MHGVPQDLDLSRFQNAELIQVCIGEYQIQFHFHGGDQISVEGKWELRDPAGSLIDVVERATLPYSHLGPLHFHVLLGNSVSNYSVNSPQSFSLRFTSGHILRVYDDSQQYESFSIHPGNIFV